MKHIYQTKPYTFMRFIEIFSSIDGALLIMYFTMLIILILIMAKVIRP